MGAGFADGDLWLGLDVGTQGTKGLVWSRSRGAVVARASEAYDLIDGLPPGAAEQHPDTWERATRDVATALVAAVAPATLSGVGVSGQQHGCVPLDADGRVIRPAKLWCDTSTVAEARELSEAWGRHLPVGFTASKVLWLKRHEPEHFARLATVLLPHDWINFRLTGRRATEAGDASGTGWFDPRTRSYDFAAATAIDARLPDALPELVEPGALVGCVDAAGAERFGLPEGLPVSAGGGDNMLSAIGAGATRPGVVVLSLGTSATVFTRTDEPVVDPAGLIAPFCDSAGGWLPLVCVMNATGVTEEVRRLVGATDDAGLARLTADAATVEPGCGGLTFLPYLAGERVPDLPEATGSLHGLRAGSLAPATLFRAALEGVSLNLAWGVDRLRGLGLDVDELRLVGGGARNALWRRILADAIDAPVVALEERESAALGGALQAAWAAGGAGGGATSLDDLARAAVGAGGERLEPDGDAVRRYAELGRGFRALVEREHGRGATGA